MTIFPNRLFENVVTTKEIIQTHLNALEFEFKGLTEINIFRSANEIIPVSMIQIYSSTYHLF